jgi:hypothetical protein
LRDPLHEYMKANKNRMTSIVLAPFS